MGFLKKIWNKIQAASQLNDLKFVTDSGWISIYQCSDIYSAKIRKLKLEEEGIEVRVLNQIDSSYNAFGYIQLHVRREKEEQVKKILDSFE
ncbi:MAG: DUF2007 domain-containing protein [Crocinitomicaceae bacterium]|jgi:hypothetical protein|nr:DUF2007 domain-containing protein [Crocinitomicaceae bacterium]